MSVFSKRYETIQVQEVGEGRVAVVALHRPPMNAFTVQMHLDLLDCFHRLDTLDSVRAIVVTGATGTKAFCAGADLSGAAPPDDDADPDADGHRGFGGGASRISDFRDEGGRVTCAIHRCRKPVIAAINGSAVGIGITLTLPMDIRVVAEDAKIGFVFARRGIVPEAASSFFLPRVVGIAKASEWCLTGRVFRAKEEASSGLFNYILPRDQVLPKAMELANEIAQNTAPVSITLTKRLLWTGLQGNSTPESAHLLDSKMIFWCGRQPDAIEGVMAFLQKRNPEFTMSPTKDLPDFYPWWTNTDITPPAQRSSL